MSKQEFTLPINSVEHLNIAKNYLNNFSLSNHNYHKYDKFDGNDNNIYAAVIVEPRCHDLLETVIRNVCYFLNQHPKLDEKDKWDIVVFHGVNNHEFIKSKLLLTIVLSTIVLIIAQLNKQM